MESLLVPDDLDRNKHAQLVVDASHDLTKATFAKYIDNLVAIGQMVTSNDGVVTTIIIVAKVGRIGLHIADHLASVLGAAKVYIVVVDDFASLVDIEHSDADCLVGADPLLGSRPLSQGIKVLGRNIGFFAAHAHLSHFVLSHHILLIELGGP
jgi:hypothetical protein